MEGSKESAVDLRRARVAPARRPERRRGALSHSRADAPVAEGSGAEKAAPGESVACRTRSRGHACAARRPRRVRQTPVHEGPERRRSCSASPPGRVDSAGVRRHGAAGRSRRARQTSVQARGGPSDAACGLRRRPRADAPGAERENPQPQRNRSRTSGMTVLTLPASPRTLRSPRRPPCA